MNHLCPYCKTVHDSRLCCPEYAERHTPQAERLRRAEQIAKNPCPAWYLDAMREGCAPVCWEVADWRDKLVARVRYFLRD